MKDATGLTIVELKKQAREEAKAAGGGKVMHQSWTTEEDNRLAALVEQGLVEEVVACRATHVTGEGNSVAIGTSITSRQASKKVSGQRKKR